MDYAKVETKPEALRELKMHYAVVRDALDAGISGGEGVAEVSGTKAGVKADAKPDVYMVGGAVRDMLLFGELHTFDFDFATPLLPDDVETRLLAAGYKVQTKGKLFGTVAFEVEDFRYEITTFRTEIYFPKNRKPEVTFIENLEDDLKRRDFTVNAIAFDGAGFIDPFGGCDDIKTFVLRSVGSAQEKFTQDPLRMLRAARLCAELDFVADEHIEAALMSCRQLLSSLSPERVAVELDRLVCAPHPAQGLMLLGDTSAIPYVLLEAIFASLVTEGYASLGKKLESVPGVPDARWAAIFFWAALAFSPDGDEGAALIAKSLATRVASAFHWSKERTEGM